MPRIPRTEDALALAHSAERDNFEMTRVPVVHTGPRLTLAHDYACMRGHL